MVRTNLLLASTLTLLAFAACGLDVIGEPLSVLPDAEGGASTSPTTSSSSSSSSGVVADAAPSEVDASPDANVPKPADAGRDAAATCNQQGARTHGGHCYFVLACGDRADGKAKCDAANAHLVSIESDAEQKAIESMGAGDRWIGLFGAVPTNNDKAKFRWPDGKNATYDHWKVGNPNEGFACVVMDRLDGDVWTDRSCTDPAVTLALCERE